MQWNLSNFNPQRLLELFNLQIYCGVGEVFLEIWFAQIIYGNSKFGDLQGLFMCQSSDKLCWISSPKFTSWYSPPWWNHRTGFKDRMGLHQRTFHKNGMLPNNAFWLNCARPQQTVCTNSDKPLNGCLCWKSWESEIGCILYTWISQQNHKKHLLTWINLDIIGIQV